MSGTDSAIDLEALKQLKASYCRLLDAKDWTGWRDLFCDEFVSDTRDSGGQLVTGADAFIGFVRANLGAAYRTTEHRVDAPELELTSASTARGIWVLYDKVRLAPGFTFHGHGRYHETYEKFAGQWRIKSSTLTRLRQEIETPILRLRIPDWLKRAMSKTLSRSEKTIVPEKP